MATSTSNDDPRPSRRRGPGHRAVRGWVAGGVLSIDAAAADLESKDGICAREVEVLEGPPGFRMRTEHRSPRVPVFVVESDEIRVEGVGAIRTVRRVHSRWVR